jgi:hypothetical protein
MQVLCKSSELAIETQCKVCGLGFALFWERQTRTERAEAMRQVDKALRLHHRDGLGPHVHPVKGFLVPEWDGPVAYSSAAILGSAPVWAL